VFLGLGSGCGLSVRPMASSSNLGGVDEEDEEEWLEFEEMTSLGGTNWIIDLCKLFGWFCFLSFFFRHSSSYVRGWKEFRSSSLRDLFYSQRHGRLHFLLGRCPQWPARPLRRILDSNDILEARMISVQGLH
jgi:hypothetical protein